MAEPNSFCTRHSSPEESSCWPGNLLESFQPTTVGNEPSGALDTKWLHWEVNQHLFMEVSYGSFGMSKQKAPGAGHHLWSLTTVFLPALVPGSALAWHGGQYALRTGPKCKAGRDRLQQFQHYPPHTVPYFLYSLIFTDKTTPCSTAILFQALRSGVKKKN